VPRFPAAFRPPASACRVILFPPGTWAFLTVGLPGTHAPGPGRGFHVPHLQDTTGVGALSTPGTAVLSLARARARPAPAASPRPVPAPRTHIPPAGLRNYGASMRVHAIHPSGLPLTCYPPDGTADPWAFPCAPHPTVTGSARQGGAGP